MTYQITRTNGSQYSQGLIPDSKIINVLDKFFILIIDW